MRQEDPFFIQTVPDYLPYQPVGGFFSSLLGVVGQVAGAVLGVPQAAPVIRKAPAAKIAAARAVALPELAERRLAALPGQIAPAGARIVGTQTIVQSLDAMGNVVKQKTLEGSPFLMNKDILAAKRVFKLSGKLAARLPKKTVKQSLTSRLKDELIHHAIERIPINGNGIPGA